MKKNKQTIIGIAAGAAALVIAGFIYARRTRGTQLINDDEGSPLRDNFKGKLNNLQRKAQKEYRNAIADGEDVTNLAKDKTSQWVNQANNM
ncbi:MAG TPA: hypothetical protein VFQ50_04090 [Flavobacterium sp.]|nr:hypothetical protein [Flavobacterium sp.]